MSRACRCLCLILLLLVVPACAWRAAGKSSLPPAEIGLLPDPSGQMGIAEAAASNTSPRYRLLEGNRVSLGFTREALWVRFALDQAPGPAPWVLELPASWLDRAELYLPRPGGGWRRLATGLLESGPVAGAGTFAFTAPAGTPQEGYAYLRLEAVLSLNTGLNLWAVDAFAAHSVRQAYLYGILFGIMATMVLVNLLVLLTTWDRAYLWYILYLLSIIAHQLLLQGQVLFLPQAIWPWVPQISLLACTFLYFCGAGFSRAFLQTGSNAPWADRLLLGVQASALVLAGLVVADQIFWGTWLAHITVVLGPAAAIAAGLRAWARGFRPARFYLMAWMILLLGGMAWGAWSMGLALPFPPPPASLTLGAALECVLLSLALADRVGVMQRERRVLVQRERRYRHLSITDELTGLYNARFFWSKLASEVHHAHELGQPLSLVLLDVDDFKRFNDSYGHPEGDKVLATLGLLLRKIVRPADSPCRYGGEEFAVLLPGAEGPEAHEVAERVRDALARTLFQPGAGSKVRVTTSLGTAQLRPDDDTSALVRRADQALYQAKARGKNRTVTGE